MADDQAEAEPKAIETAEPDQRLRQAELIISHVLRGGVVASAGIIAIGVLRFYLQMAFTGQVTLNYPHTLPTVIEQLTRGEPLAIVMLGLLVLLLTPILRVAISIVVFALERDWLYTIITLLVLLILLVSLLLGRGGA